MSTKKDIKVEICSKCHPFFTGKQKLVDTGGRVGLATGRQRPIKRERFSTKEASASCSTVP